MSRYHESLQAPLLRWTGDNIPHSDHYGDIYFSPENGLAETEHVFIAGNHLRERWQNLASGARFIIGETGFGSGLNFLCAAAAFLEVAPPDTRLHFFSVEKHPFTAEDLDRTLSRHPKSLSVVAKALVEQYPLPVRGLHRLILCDGRIHLTLFFGEATEGLNATPFLANAWFLDGFAPRVNPEMWQAPLFQHLANHSAPDATLATFTAAGDVRRGLEACGFDVRRSPGFGHKRHMIQATFRTPSECVEDKSPPMQTSHVASRGHVVVVGAGISGACCTYLLSQAGWRVTLIDQAGIANGASGNPQGALYIKPGIEWSAHTRLHVAAFLFAHRFYQHIAKLPSSLWQPTGLIDLQSDAKEHRRQLKLLAHNAFPEALLRPVCAEEASQLAGLALTEGGLHFERGGWLNPEGACHHLIEASGARVISPCQFQGVKRTEAGDLEIATSTQTFTTNHLILATANLPPSFPLNLPFKPIKGQISRFRPTPATALLRTTLCGEGYVMPVNEGMQLAGASFHVNLSDTEPSAQDDWDNLQKLKALLNLPDAELPADVEENRGAVRYSLPDYMPTAGELSFAAPQHGRSGVWHLGALGSKGLVLAPLLSQYLADCLGKSVPSLDLDLSDRISPQRFNGKV